MSNGLTTATTSGLQIQGSLVLTIGDQNYTLTGDIGKLPDGKPKIVVSYHKPFDEAIQIGSVITIISGVATAMGLDGSAFDDKWNDAKTKIDGIPVLKPIVTLLESPIRITDLEINTVTQTYQFGFAIVFDPPVGLDGVPLTLDAFGLKLTYQKPAAP